MKILYFLSVLFCWQVATATPPLHYYRLDNGLQVILSVNNNFPVVNQTLWYRVGSQDEAPGKSGMAHILEHLMFKGTDANPDGFSHIVSLLGGRENASTSRYYTNYFQTIASQHWHEMAALEAERMTELQFDAAEMQTEIDVVYEERLSRVDNNPQSLLSERALRALFAGYPYGNPIAGWGREILAHKKDLAAFADFYRRHYRPDNAILVVSGDIELAEAKRVIEKTYGRIPASPPPPVPEIFEPQLPSGYLQTEVSFSHPDVTQEILMLLKAAPTVGYHDGKQFRQSDILPLMIIADILNSPDFTLHADLVERQKLLLDLGIYYSALGRSPAAFTLYFVPSPEADLHDTQASVQERLTAIAGAGVTAEQVEQAKIRIGDSLLLSYDSLHFYPNLAARALVSGWSLAEFESWGERLSSVTAAEVNDTLQYFFGEKTNGGVWAYLLKE